MANTDSNGKDAVRQVFVGALDRPTAEREAWVRAACRGDEALRQRVARLLRSHRRAADRDFLVAEAPTSDPDEGRSIGPYHLVRLLGEGGFGRVYLAAQREPIVRDVAVKLVKPGMDGKHVLARFDAERQALALMDHVNIARILDAGATAESRPFFVMEYVDGLPITDYCDGRTLQIRERLEIFVQVCLAVHHAHQKGVIHRDLKPSNLLVAESDAGPVPKIIDFGIAKALAVPLTAHTLHTGEQQLLGTPAYMSPEQARVAGDQSDIDTRSDIYSLGAVLYKLLTGTTPLSAADVAAHGHDLQRAIRATRTTLPSQRALAAASDDDRVAFDRRADPGELARLLRGDLDWIALKALEHDRQRRYDSATALADDVRRHLDHEPVLARRPGAGYLLWKFVRRHQVVASSIAFAALALVVGLVLALHGLLEAGRQAELVRTQLREVHLSQARAHRAGDAPGRRQASLAAIAAASAIARSDDLRDEVIACLGLTDVLPLRSFADCGAIYGDGSRAHTRLAQWQPGAGIAVLASETGDRLTTLPLTADPRAVSFSADGSRLAAVTEDRRVTVFDVDTQRIVFERAGIEPSPHAIAFDRGAVPPRWLALTSGEGSVRTFGLDNGSELAVLPVGEGKVALASSPLGDRLAITTDGPAAEIRIHDVASGALQRRIRPPDGLNDLTWHPRGDLLAGGSDDNNVYVWSVASGDLVAALAGHQGTVVDVAFDGSGDVLVTAAWDNSVRFWDLRTRAPLIAPIFGNRFLAVAGSTVLTAAGDQVNAWHLERATELLRTTADDIFGGSATVTATADGRLLATAGHNGVRLWDGASVRPLAVAAAEPARGAVLAADGEMVVAGVGDRVLRWSVPRAVGSAGLGAAEVVYSGERIRSVTRGPTDDSVLVADRRGLVLVDRRTGARLAALPRHDGMETGASVSPDGRFAFTGTWRGAPARVRALGSGSELARWEGAHVIGVFGPANRWLCVASTDEFLLVEVGTWRSVRRIPRAQPDTIAGAIAFATDGHTVALGITRYATALVSTADGRVLARFENPDHIAATDLAFGDGDGRLVLVSPSRALMAWDLGEVRNRLRSLDLDWNERIGARR